MYCPDGGEEGGRVGERGRKGVVLGREDVGRKSGESDGGGEGVVGVGLFVEGGEVVEEGGMVGFVVGVGFG